MNNSDPLPFSRALIAAAERVADVVTSPTSPLVEATESLGISMINGTDMASSQSGLIASMFGLSELFSEQV